ncbi:MAG: NUDIX hydrolase [Candidatus Aenigmatarchaeota archaeon]|nr:NUDIX hydrolase [Candidatus Aenigmarchaeota archaeon]
MSNEEQYHLGIKALILNKQNQVLILKTNPEELKGDKTIHWDLPGGRVKKGDSIETTLRKEVKEELDIDKIEILSHFDSFISNIRIPVKDYDVGLILFVYKCKIDENSKIKLSFEHTEYKWASIEEAKELLSYKYPKSFIEKLDFLLKKQDI